MGEGWAGWAQARGDRGDGCKEVSAGQLLCQATGCKLEPHTGCCAGACLEGLAVTDELNRLSVSGEL